MKTSAGFVGLGMMGLPMARRLVNAGYEVRIHNRTRSKAEALLHDGAFWCDTPSAAAASSVVHSMVSTPEALRHVVDGPEGILAGLPAGGIHIDHSTVSPDLTRELSERYAASGRIFLHAPVLGSIPNATDGSLLLFVGGDEGGYARVEPMLKVLGNRIWRLQRPEQATALKLICNSFIAGMIGVLGQALVLARKSDVDPALLLEVIGQSQLNAPTYQTKGKSILSRNFEPRFYLEHLVKDVRLVLDLAQSRHSPMPLTEAVRDLLLEATKQGLAEQDYSAVVKVLEKAAGLPVAP